MRLPRCRLRRIGALTIVVAVLVLSGCGAQNYAEDARNESIRNAAGAFSSTVKCFGELQLTPGEDLVALAKENGLCGSWLTLGATDDELSTWSWTLKNDTALIRIDESTGSPVVTMLTAGDGRAEYWNYQEEHTLIVCWQAALDPSGGKPRVTGIECPQAWLETWGAPEVMTLKALKKAAGELGMTFTS